ncbi:MAG TPA: translation initiation factor IF-2 [Acidimicrobiales bacterium]|nr:translation initiation factor IF-2 [Acidimicrobiales bacterium]
MAKKIRVYELARELGLTNKEALDLCLALGIGVKSHSSSIEDAQADRVRRKADAEGLRRDVSPPEPASGRAAKATAETPAPRATEDRSEVPGRRVVSSRGSTTVAPAPERPAARPAATERPVAPAPERPADRPAATERPSTPPPERPAARPAATERPAAPAPERPAATERPVAPVPERPAARPAAAERPPSTAPPPRPDIDRPTTERPRPERPAETGGPPARVDRPAAAATGAPTSPAAPPADGAAPARTRPPVSPTGRAIPPPPGRTPMSQSGRPIPPPPGMGGRRPPPPSSTRPAGGSGYPQRSGGRPAPSGAGRPSGGGGFGGRPSGGGFGGRAGGAGPVGGGPPAGRGGVAGRGRPPQRRSRRRRRNLEELEPTQLTTYTPSTAPVPEGEIIVERGSTARDLGPKLNRSAGDVIRFLLLQGEMVTATQSLTDDMIELFAAELGAEVRLVDPGEEQEAELLARFFEEDDEEEEQDLRPRPPVVTVMGHVDHGKTLLLDRIRSTDVVAGEAGGITQHIGAYQVSWQDHLITFIDTPGHEAFTAMRARGARITDVVVLVVAADDGVMPQTVEAIDHARAADVPIIVAVNKIDRPDANPERVLQQLSERGLVPEQWGGDTITVPVSALTGEGIDQLLEQLVLVAEVEELQSSPEGRARGTVLEANLEDGRGPVATVIVQSGTLRVSDPLVAGSAWGKVRALVDDHGDHVKEALPSMPVQVLGFSEPPQAGDELRVAKDLSTARTLGEARAQRFRLSGHLPAPSAATGARLEDLFEQIQRGETATLNLVLKADVQGSLEAVTESLRKLEREDVKLSFVHRGVGGITENDVQLARASNATIIGFNVRPDRRSREMAEVGNVEIRTYEIIYKLLEDIEAAMLGMLSPEFEEVITGEAEVRQVFRIPRVGAVAGCMVRNGTITRGSKVRFLRDGVIIWRGTINTLRRFKEDVREVQAGFECGIGLSDFQDLKEGDIIETFEEREIPRT